MTTPRPVVVNRYLVQNGDHHVLVLYWYQGRGRVQAREYLVKWDLLRNAALHPRTEEALVHVVTPITSNEERSFDLAASAAAIGWLRASDVAAYRVQ